MNILLTNSGRRTYFLEFLVKLKKKISNLKIHVCDSNCNSSTFSFKNVKKHITPRVSTNSKKYIESIIKIVRKNKIGLLIPLTDLDITLLSQNIDRFKRLKCVPLVSDKKICKIFSDKIETNKFCLNNKIKTPKILSKKILKRYIKTNFVIKKKISGSSSDGLKILKKNSKIEFNKKFFFQEYIKGSELHFDILNDFHGKFLDACIKKKISMRAGETDVAMIVNKKKYLNLAKYISSKTKHIGNLDCDAIEDKKKNIYFFDFNLRFGGGYAFTHSAGYNYLKSLIFLMKGKKIKLNSRKQKMIFSKGISVHKTYDK